MTISVSQLRQQTLDPLAQELANAWKSGGVIGELNGDRLPVSRDEAYFVQDRMAASLNEKLAGWKVGATSARMREIDGHDDVIPGRILMSTTWRGNDLSLPASRFANARVETEFAFRLAGDLPLRSKPWTASELAPIATLHPALEIIGNRHVPPDGPASVRSLMTIADNGGGIGFVFGDPVESWQEIDFQNHHIALRVDNGTEAENFLGDMRCIPIQAVADLANHLASRQIPLFAGDFVSTGAATVPQPVGAGSRVKADFGVLGRINIRFE